MPLIVDNLVSEGLLDFKNKRSQVAATTVSASTQILVVGSEHIQSYSGSTAAQVVKLPDATTLTVGYQYWLLNDSTVNIIIQNFSATQLFLLEAGQRLLVVCLGTGSAAGTWSLGVMTSTTPGGEQFKFTYPGTGLSVNYTGGNYRQNGVLTIVAGGSIALPASTTGTAYVDTDGVVKATASIPSGASPLYNFVTTATVVTSLADVREDIEANLVWAVVGDMPTVVAGQAKSAGTLEKYARGDHTHNNGALLAKAGTVAAGSFAGSPKKVTITFATSFGSTAYSIQIQGTDNRSFTWESKLATGFVINANSNTALTGNVDWLIIGTGEAV